MNLPELFDLTYIGPDNQRHRPVMIHRVVFGALERFIGIITEHFAGAFPLWLAPVQVKVLPIVDACNEYCDIVAAELEAAGIRVEKDHRSEKLASRFVRPSLSACPTCLWSASARSRTAPCGTLTQNGSDGRHVALELLSKLREEIDTRHCEFCSRAFAADESFAGSVYTATARKRRGRKMRLSPAILAKISLGRPCIGDKISFFFFE